MQQKLIRRSIFHTPLFILSLLVFLLTSCNHGVTIHPSKLTPEMRKECAAALAGLYDTKVRVISTIAGTEREVKIENGKRVEYFESQDSTLQLKTTILDYDNGMKLILHNFPLSTIAKALPDSLGDLRTAIAYESDKELTVTIISAIVISCISPSSRRICPSPARRRTDGNITYASASIVNCFGL